MSNWRMAFRVGNHGTSLWSNCKSLGVAAITYYPVVNIDFSNIQRNSFPKEWKKLAPTQKSSLSRVVYEMKPGDYIYVKEGNQIVGKGKVLSSYFFDSNNTIIDQNKMAWPHQVKVEWDEVFEPIKILLGAEQHTVYPINQSKLRKIDKLEKNEEKKQIEKIQFIEGDTINSEIEFKYRNRDLITAKKAKSDYNCEICSFNFKNYYGEIGESFIEAHHLNPINKGSRVSTVDDLILVCSNCHSMIHKKNPPYEIEDIKKMIKKSF